MRITLLLLPLLVTSGCSRKQTTGAPDDAGSHAAGEKLVVDHFQSKGFVGSDACRECHQEIWSWYQSHPMAHSTTLVTEDPREIYEEGTAFRPGGRCVYKVERDEAEVLHHEMMYDQQGGLLYDQAVPVHYTVGSGARARAYVIDRGDGILVQSPINWYAGAPQWDLAPGYFGEDHPRFDRRITTACLACHSGRFLEAPGQDNRFHDPPFFELGIGCENCHGPGQKHIELQRGGIANGTDDTIVNPAKLDPVRRESVCNRCHLQVPAPIERYGKSLLDFQPGDNLEDYVTMLLSSSGVTGEGETTAVRHVPQMHESKCYQESAGQFGCISCHDPHRKPAASEKDAFYRDKCLQCHADQGCNVPLPKREQEAANACARCHMPRLKAENVPHTVQTDHRVLRGPQPGVESDPDRPAATLAFFDGADERLPEWERDRAVGLGIIDYLSRFGQYPALENVVPPLLNSLEHAPDDVEVWNSLGHLTMKHGDLERAQFCFEKAIEYQPEHEAALAGLVLSHYQARDFDKSLEYMERFLELNTWESSLYAVQADMLWNTGDREKAVEAAQRALEINPRYEQMHEWLMNVYRELGDEAASARHAAVLQRQRLAPATPVGPRPGAMSPSELRSP